MKRLGVAVFLDNLYSMIYMKKIIPFALFPSLIGENTMAVDVSIMHVLEQKLWNMFGFENLQLVRQPILNAKMKQNALNLILNWKGFGR